VIKFQEFMFILILLNNAKLCIIHYLRGFNSCWGGVTDLDTVWFISIIFFTFSSIPELSDSSGSQQRQLNTLPCAVGATFIPGVYVMM